MPFKRLKLIWKILRNPSVADHSARRDDISESQKSDLSELLGEIPKFIYASENSFAQTDCCSISELFRMYVRFRLGDFGVSTRFDEQLYRLFTRDYGTPFTEANREVIETKLLAVRGQWQVFGVQYCGDFFRDEDDYLEREQISGRK